MRPTGDEAYISVDIETAGPNPARYSMLSIGACTVLEPIQTFYIEIKPTSMEAMPEALAVSKLSMEDLFATGVEPEIGLKKFEDWLTEVVPEGVRPIFVAFNAPFDWMFINEYFYRYLGRNPFGHSALDIKSFYMGMKGVQWKRTGMNTVSMEYLDNRMLSHHALKDAMDQGELFRKMLLETGIISN